MSNYREEQERAVNLNIFREMFEIRIRIEERMISDNLYEEEFTDVIRSIDRLFDRILNE